MAGVIVGAVGGYGPFDVAAPAGLTEYGGGSGLVEGSPNSQSAVAGVVHRNGTVTYGPGLEHVADMAATMSVDEQLGVLYRGARASQEDPGSVDPITGDVVLAAGNGLIIDPETGIDAEVIP